MIDTSKRMAILIWGIWSLGFFLYWLFIGSVPYTINYANVGDILRLILIIVFHFVGLIIGLATYVEQ